MRWLWLALVLPAQGVSARSGYPVRPVRIVVSFVPVETPDIPAPALAATPSEALSWCGIARRVRSLHPCRSAQMGQGRESVRRDARLTRGGPRPISGAGAAGRFATIRWP